MDFKMGDGSKIVCKKSLNPKVHKIDATVFPNCDIVLISILELISILIDCAMIGCILYRFISLLILTLR